MQQIIEKNDIKKLETKKLPPLSVMNKNFGPNSLSPRRTLDLPPSVNTRPSEAPSIVHVEREEEKGIAREAGNNVSRSTIDMHDEGKRTPNIDLGSKSPNGGELHSFNPLLLNDQQRARVAPQIVTGIDLSGRKSNEGLDELMGSPRNEQ